MRIPQQHERDHDFGAMTPMIDIVFLLLIFFVVTASGGVREELLPTELSAAGAVESDITPVEPQELTVDIWLKLMFEAEGKKTRVDMNGTVYEDLERLKEQLRALAELGPENPVILDIAGDVPLGDVVDVYDTCQAAGFESVSFAADAPKSN
ncbi:ExbD/TolR family protein [Thalassoglobus sp.]|uniref:ExbD/TolR family protein n=1 Tax=Thalassoglobus sp. TaxID=2795869 RepID=UPI003AA88C55